MNKKFSLLGEKAQKHLTGIVRFPKSWQGTCKNAFVAVQSIGLPLVAKMPFFMHKTEKKAVRIVHTKEMFEKTLHDFERIAKKEKMKCTVLLQEFIEGIELIAGLKKDAVFGHVLLLGLGGVFAEVFKDVTFRVCPITKNDAEKMIEELQCKTLLEGPRGLPKANKTELVKTLIRLSQLPKKHSRIIELDINPLIVNEQDAFAVDVRIVKE